jgi:hypothetical protein
MPHPIRWRVDLDLATQLYPLCMARRGERPQSRDPASRGISSVVDEFWFQKGSQVL